MWEIESITKGAFYHENVIPLSECQQRWRRCITDIYISNNNSYRYVR